MMFSPETCTPDSGGNPCVHTTKLTKFRGTRLLMVYQKIAHPTVFAVVRAGRHVRRGSERQRGTPPSANRTSRCRHRRSRHARSRCLSATDKDALLPLLAQFGGKSAGQRTRNVPSTDRCSRRALSSSGGTTSKIEWVTVNELHKF